jgi:hypothetical protein
MAQGSFAFNTLHSQLMRIKGVKYTTPMAMIIILNLISRFIVEINLGSIVNIR